MELWDRVWCEELALDGVAMTYGSLVGARSQERQEGRLTPRGTSVGRYTNYADHVVRPVGVR
jgi:hypothetical protein